MEQIRVRQRRDLVFEARGDYENPYMDVDVWVYLTGPGFDRRVYGFWDGGRRFVS